jgi:hypothetical protein
MNDIPLKNRSGIGLSIGDFPFPLMTYVGDGHGDPSPIPLYALFLVDVAAGLGVRPDLGLKGRTLAGMRTGVRTRAGVRSGTVVVPVPMTGPPLMLWPAGHPVRGAAKQARDQEHRQEQRADPEETVPDKPKGRDPQVGPDPQVAEAMGQAVVR